MANGVSGRAEVWHRRALDPLTGEMLNRLPDIKPYILSFAAALGGLLIALSIELILDVHGTSRVFLVAVLISAIAYGLWPGVFASLISAIAYDYFFLPPIYSLDIATNQGIVDFAMFMLVALVVSTLAARVRRYALAADQRALTAQKLSAFTQHLAESDTVETILRNAAERMSVLLCLPVALILMEGEVPVVNSVFPPNDEPDAGSVRIAVARWALRPEATTSQGYKIGDWCFRPLRGANESLGLIATRDHRTDPDSNTLLTALGNQTGLALDRCILRDRLEQSRMQGETERLRATVLTSISHDLRNPLASITVSASVLERQWDSLADSCKLSMLSTLRREAERLSDFIDKLLDLTSIDEKIIKSDRRRVCVADVVEAALQRASALLAGHPVEIAIPEDLLPVWSDPMLLQQVLYNLIDNAVKYSRPESVIRIAACEDGRSIRIRVLDEGAGLPDDDLERIFGRFYRSACADRHISGAGLGLAICRGFVEIMCGTIEAANRDDRAGAVFTVTLPAAIEQELLEVDR